MYRLPTFCEAIHQAATERVDTVGWAPDYVLKIATGMRGDCGDEYTEITVEPRWKPDFGRDSASTRVGHYADSITMLDAAWRIADFLDDAAIHDALKAV